MNALESNIEALIFCSPKPIKVKDIQKTIFEYDKTTFKLSKIESGIQNLTNKYKDDSYAIEIIESGGGYQFVTKNKFSRLNEILLKQQSRRRLSIPALETLSIIAYKQPITKSNVEKIRGVNCDYTIQKLLDKELIEIKEKSDKVGRPLIYATSQKFMDYFGINNLSQLPTLKDFQKEENIIGDENEL